MQHCGVRTHERLEASRYRLTEPELSGVERWTLAGLVAEHTEVRALAKQVPQCLILIMLRLDRQLDKTIERVQEISQTTFAWFENVAGNLLVSLNNHSESHG